MHDNESDDPDDDDPGAERHWAEEHAREERERLDDDGAEYSDPRDEIEERRKALDARFDSLMDFVTGPRPEDGRRE